ncbi:Z1 domain-containing protein [Cellulomonas sp. T2.31MG-18]|uniref:Z1 domain-containing protein n=1 Tax=Cellulomonas sp. T2.31MG-18 TaxID=3157619 RepID=UPI00367101C7
MVRTNVPRSARRLLVNEPHAMPTTWSRQASLEAVSLAATYEWPLTSTTYDSLIRQGEVRGPSSVRLSQVFGSWRAVCVEAEVEPVAPQRDDYQSRWTDGDLLDWVADYLRSPGSLGTYGGYERWRAETSLDAPSAPTVRNRLGTWGNVKRQALSRTKENGETVAMLGPEAQRLDKVLAQGMDERTRTNIWHSVGEVLEQGPLGDGRAGETCLALGLVQSGKTTSITALLAAAADAGYRIAVALLGSTNLLLDQNRRRLEDALGIGARQDYVWVTEPNLSGLPGSRRVATHLDRGRVVLIPVLKHAGRIRALSESLQHLGLSQPALIIDDEADQSSLNTGGDNAESRTYEAIRYLRAALPNHLYVQYTATPYGPLMLDAEDLLQPESVVFLQPGAGYTGGREFFVDFADKVVRDVPVIEEQASKTAPLALPNSLERAFASFCVGAALLMVNGAADAPFSMLVHSTARNDVQTRYHFLLGRQIKTWRRALDDAAALAELPAVFAEERARLIGSGAEDVEDTLLLNQLRVVMRECNLWLVNSSTAITKIDWTVSPVHVLVGGNKLDRGFTVEGLTVTYMNRPASPQVDTLEQRARAFGYRRKLLPYCQFFASRRTIRSLRDIVFTEYDLRARLQDHVDDGGSVHTWATEVGLLLPEGMKPTRDTVVTALSSTPAGWHSLRRPVLSEEEVRHNESLVAALGLFQAPFEDHQRLAFRTLHLNASEVIERLLAPWAVESYSPSWRHGDLLDHLQRTVDQNGQVPVLLMEDNGRPRQRRWDDQVGFINLFQGRDLKPQPDGAFYPGDRSTPDLDRDPDRVVVQVHRVVRRNVPDRELLTLALHLGSRGITRKMNDD